MARNVRWYLPFKSLNGVSCRVDIYDNDWPSYIDPMQLVGADNPFYYEDDASDDLLNDVIRYRTGYIRIIDDELNDQSNIYPSSTFDRFVNVLYDNVVVFNGYIQVQSFSKELTPAPRVVELPVISPLGLFNKRMFSNILPPTSVSLGDMLNRALANSNYERVYVPDISDASLSQMVFSLAFSPWNDNYHHSMTTSSYHNVMKGKSFDYLIECICKAFGWICHDTPTALVFTSFDYEGSYVYYPVGHIGDSSYKTTDSTPSESVSLSNFFSIADNHAVESIILPDSGIEISYEGEMSNINFSFARTYFNGIESMPGFTVDDGERYSLCNLQSVPFTYEILDTSYASFDSDGKVVVGESCVAWNGHIGILVSVSASYESGRPLFRLRYYDRRLSGKRWSLRFKGMSSYNGPGLSNTSLAALHDDDKVASYYVQAVTSLSEDYVEIAFSYHYAGDDSDYPKLPDRTLMFIEDIVLELIEHNEPYAQYRYLPAGDKDIISINGDVTTDGNYPPISSSITMPISMYRLNDRLVGNALKTTKLTTYPYLFRPRNKIVSKFVVDTMPSMPYLRLFSYLENNWRIIGQSFDPWNDVFVLTMQNSPLLD